MSGKIFHFFKILKKSRNGILCDNTFFTRFCSVFCIAGRKIRIQRMILNRYIATIFTNCNFYSMFFGVKIIRQKNHSFTFYIHFMKESLGFKCFHNSIQCGIVHLILSFSYQDFFEFRKGNIRKLTNSRCKNPPRLSNSYICHIKKL